MAYGSIDDVSSPFFLHLPNSPGLILVSQTLIGENYNSWRRAMRMALMAKNMLGFVDSSIAQPDESAASFQLWQRNNNIVASWLVNSISKEIAASVIYSTTASEIWAWKKDVNSKMGQEFSNSGRRLSISHKVPRLLGNTTPDSKGFTCYIHRN